MSDSTITITWEGRDWKLDQESISVQQGIAMFLAWGFTLESWEEALKATDPRAMQCLYWLMLQQNDVQKPIKECEFDLLGYFSAYFDAMQAAEAQEPAPEPEPEVPTSPAGPPSPEPPIPPATTPQPPAPGEVAPSTGSSPAS